MEKELKCNSCKEDVRVDCGAAAFKCPGCSKEIIARCARCRKTAVRYKCLSCGFSGPN